MASQIFTVQTAPLYVLVHASCAAMAVVLGGYLLARPKGTRLHRSLGRIWAALMLVIALGSFQIQSEGRLSWIHLLSLVTLYFLCAGLVAARRGHTLRHRGCMKGAYTGLVVAGPFTLLPYRMLGQLLFGSL